MSSLLPSDGISGIIESPALAFAAGIAVWILTLAIITIQKKTFPRVPKQKMLQIASIELLFALAAYHFIFASQKIFIGFPSVLAVLVVTILWLVGIGYCYRLYGGNRAMKQQILFLIPFTIPFLLITALGDSFVPNDQEWLLYSVASVVVLLLLMIFMPALIQMMWRCKPMEQGELLDKLNLICQRANFKHSGILMWTIMSDTVTAAIIGVVPSYRYVMFTQRIIDVFKPEWLEAVLAHEIGHSKHKHLMMYPLITIGMAIIAAAVASLVMIPIGNLFVDLADQYAWPYWTELYTFSLFFVFAIAIALAFRFIFGYFSRIFERQADLYIFRIGLDPAYMVDALNELGNVTGKTHDHPNWHHYSIRQRINFIEAAAVNPRLIPQHDTKVRISLAIYFAIVIYLLFI